jgi:probable addiction module antidote protein
MMKVSELKEFDAAEALTEPADVLAYLNVVLEENDPGAFAEALGTIARTDGMAKIAESTGLAREALYKALGPKAAAPRLDTISKVLNSLGFKLTVQPIKRHVARKIRSRKPAEHAHA